MQWTSWKYNELVDEKNDNVEYFKEQVIKVKRSRDERVENCNELVDEEKEVNEKLKRLKSKEK